MKIEQMLSIGREFIKDFAARHDMPELALKAQDTGGKTTEDGIVFSASISPRGQMAALVSSLLVEVFIRKSSDVDLLYATVHLSYTHPSGGSNGFGSDYRLITDKTIGSNEVNYVGYISRRLEHAMIIERRDAVKKVEV